MTTAAVSYKSSLVHLADELKKGKRPLIRTLYFTLKPMGREGAQGQLEQGDLIRDPYSKLVYYDAETGLYNIQRKETPAEKVPSEDIIAMLRSFLRQAPVQGAFITLAETDPTTGKESILKLLKTYEVDDCFQPSTSPAHLSPLTTTTDQGQSSSMSTMVLMVIAVIAVGAGYYYYTNYYKKKSTLPQSSHCSANRPQQQSSPAKPFIIQVNK